MKIRISMPGAYMVMDMEEGQARTAAKKADEKTEKLIEEGRE